MRAIFAANRRVPLPQIADHLVRTLASLPMEVTVLLRAPRNGQPQHFERLAAELCESIAIPVEWYRPETSGREGTFDRDWRLARAADRAIIYLAHDSPQDAGTRHLLDAVISSEIESTAYTTYDEPELTLAWLGGL